MKKIFLITLSVVSLYTFMIAKDDTRSFLISPGSGSRPTSANELKENIGEQLKRALFDCNAISADLGNLQSELAHLQNRLLSRVEGLVENRRLFRKAKRKELAEALKTIATVKKELGSQREGIKKIVLNMNNNKCLREEKTT